MIGTVWQKLAERPFGLGNDFTFLELGLVFFGATVDLKLDIRLEKPISSIRVG